MGETSKRRRFPWLKVALALSLVVNLVFVGIFAGVFHRAGQGGSVLRTAFSALPAEDRRQLRRETGAIWREARGARDTPRAPPLMIEALRAQEFEQDAFAEALHAAQRRLLHLSDEMHAQLIAHVASMSPEDRARYADALEEQMQTRRWRGR
ncbi:MAG: periplasmic heavy metal sensor [Rhodobacteraceae bacterium]|nr:MAG: periplasmic heavy metal sensor [Paracoccaceae bacterium]